MTRTMWQGKKECASYRRVQSSSRMLSIASLPEYVMLLQLTSLSLTKRVQGVKVKESSVFTRKYCTEVTSLSTLSVFEVEIWCYRGGTSTPMWINRNTEDFSTLCIVQADLSPLAGSAQSKPGKSGKTYWTIVFSVEIHFGLTEFKARIKWVDSVSPSPGCSVQRLRYALITGKDSLVSKSMKCSTIDIDYDFQRTCVYHLQRRWTTC
jgi:hypothetical protein